jgi:hypothetical protein
LGARGARTAAGDPVIGIRNTAGKPIIVDLPDISGFLGLTRPSRPP